MPARIPVRVHPLGAARAVPPRIAGQVLTRPHLEGVLDAALTRRVTVLSADAGFGKSTLLAQWLRGRAWAWYTVGPADRDLSRLASGIIDALSLRAPGVGPSMASSLSSAHGPDAEADEALRAMAYASLIAESLEQHLVRDMVLVLDDVNELGPRGSQTRLLEAMVLMAPSRLHIVIASREAMPFSIERLRGKGEAGVISGSLLAFSLEETAEMLRLLLDDSATSLAEMLYRATGGWPAATRLAIEAIRTAEPDDRERMLRRAFRPGGTVWDYFASEAISRADPEVRNLLRLASPLPRFSVPLCEALGIDNAAAILPALADRGLFVQPSSADDWYELHPLLRQAAPAELRLGDSERRDILRRAADWFSQHHASTDALSCLVASADGDRIAELLAQQGGALLDAGEVDAVLDALAHLQADARRDNLDALEGEARQMRGDWDGALQCYRRVARERSDVPAGVCWRMGLILHLRGRLDEALATYARGRLGDDDLANAAMLNAWWASALWLRGDVDQARVRADAALSTAARIGDDRAMAAGHTVLAMIAAVESDRRANDGHYLRALEHATRAHDTLQLIRIHANRGSHFVEEGYYQEALTELDESIRLADLGGFAAFRALALSNHGEALFRLGRLDDAIAELDASRALFQRLDSGLVSYPLGHLGDVYRERGDITLARAHYEEALAVARPAGDVQGLVPALAGLARVLVDTEPDLALQLCLEATAHGRVLGGINALLALGWVRLARGERTAARTAAEEAEELARQRRDRAGLAEAIELGVRAAPDPRAEGDRLAEAGALWKDLGNELGIGHVELAYAELLAADDGRESAERALARFRAIGARRAISAAEVVLESMELISPREIAIRTLGGFAVLRRGRPVAVAEWRSRKARDALKVLVSARGGRVTRDVLMETLWPEEDPRRTGPRLSVVLSTIRAVFDPEKANPSDHYVTTDRNSAWLVLSHISVDLEEFHAAARRGTELVADGLPDDAWPFLQTAESTYGGEFLAEDAYEDWSTPAREEARSTYQQVLRALAKIAMSRAQPDLAARYLRRHLEQDPYDEPAHLGLIAALAAAGHHGEARLAYRRYSSRMEELNVEAAPLPDAVRSVGL